MSASPNAFPLVTITRSAVKKLRDSPVISELSGENDVLLLISISELNPINNKDKTTKKSMMKKPVTVVVVDTFKNLRSCID